MSDSQVPTKPPYVDAKDDTELNAALAGISDTLATCSFGVDGFPDNADKSSYLCLNGQSDPL